MAYLPVLFVRVLLFPNYLTYMLLVCVLCTCPSEVFLHILKYETGRSQKKLSMVSLTTYRLEIR